MHKKGKTLNTIVEQLEAISKFLDSKKAVDVLQVNVQESTALCDFFVLASASNSTQVKALSEGLEEELSKKYGIEPKCREGMKEGQWAVIDYGDIIVHIFLEQVRERYGLDKLWVNTKNTINYSQLAEALALEKRKQRLLKTKEQEES